MAYLFVDGAYLTAALNDWGNDWFEEAAPFEPLSLGAGFEKTFYYDAMPASGKCEDPALYASRLEERLAFFNKLRAVPGWHVFEGVTKRRGKGKASRVDQKEVDVLIAVDMLTHTYRKNTERIGFVAGDLDFRPLLEAVVREGMYVELIFEPRSASEELKHAADSWRPLEFFAMHGVCTAAYKIAHPIPVHSHIVEPLVPGGAVCEEHGRIGDKLVAKFWRSTQIVENGRTYITSAVPVNEHGHFAYMEMHNNVELLKRVYEHIYGGPFVWFAPEP